MSKLEFPVFTYCNFQMSGRYVDLFSTPLYAVSSPNVTTN